MKKDERCEIRLSKDDSKKISERMAELGMTNRSGFIRLCALNTEIINIDGKDIFMDIELLKKIYDSIMQIKKQLKSTSNSNNLYERDMEEIKKDCLKLYQKQLSVLSSLEKLMSQD